MTSTNKFYKPLFIRMFKFIIGFTYGANKCNQLHLLSCYGQVYKTTMTQWTNKRISKNFYDTF
jgi:hypothetical protein